MIKLNVNLYLLVGYKCCSHCKSIYEDKYSLWDSEHGKWCDISNECYSYCDPVVSVGFIISVSILIRSAITVVVYSTTGSTTVVVDSTTDSTTVVIDSITGSITVVVDSLTG